MPLTPRNKYGVSENTEPFVMMCVWKITKWQKQAVRISKSLYTSLPSGQNCLQWVRTVNVFTFKNPNAKTARKVSFLRQRSRAGKRNLHQNTKLQVWMQVPNLNLLPLLLVRANCCPHTAVQNESTCVGRGEVSAAHQRPCCLLLCLLQIHSSNGNSVQWN